MPKNNTVKDEVSSDELETELQRVAWAYVDSNDAMLSAPKGRFIQHPDGYKEWREYSSNGAPRIRKKHMYSEKQVAVFAQKYNTYFHALTGKHIDFHITPTSQPYLSVLSSCRHRDQVLMTLFEEPPVIWELMGGSGSDSIAFMLDLAPRKIVIVEYGIGEHGEKLKEKQALIHNISSFCSCFDEYKDAFDALNPGNPDKRVRVHYTTARDFINHANPVRADTGKRERMHVNMVYLDPSWDKAFYQAVEGQEAHRSDDEADGEKYVPNVVEEYESTPEELFHYLEAQVWKPLEENNIDVDVFVLKTRWEWSQVQKQLEQVNSKYYTPYSIQAVPFREHLTGKPGKYGEIEGQFHWITMIRKNYRTIYDHRPEWYMDLMRRGKTIYVDERTTIKPFHPRYTDHLLFPTVYNSPHEHCFQVVPPDARKEPAPRPEKYKTPENWRDQSGPKIPPPPDTVWKKRREEKEREPKGPGYKGRYDVLLPESGAKLQSLHKSRLLW
jgi:hypothetical protein